MLTYLKALTFEETDSVFHSLGKLLLFKMLWHIDHEEIDRVPDFSGREYGVNGSQDHPGHGNDSPFLSPAL